MSTTEQTPAMTAGKDTRVILRCLYGGGNRVLAIMPDIPGAKEGEFACFTISTRFGVTNYKKIMKESFEVHMEDQEVIDTLCDLSSTFRRSLFDPTGSAPHRTAQNVRRQAA
jgi:hypothetical protein